MANPSHDPTRVRAALTALMDARNILAKMDNPPKRTLARVRLAISSAKGAVRNAESRPYRSEAGHAE